MPQMSDQVVSLVAAIARLDREGQEREQKLQNRTEELERHANWLETRVGQLFVLVLGALAYVIAEQWLGKFIITLAIAFCTGVILTLLLMEGWKTPILWRYLLRNRSR